MSTKTKAIDATSLVFNEASVFAAEHRNVRILRETLFRRKVTHAEFRRYHSQYNQSLRHPAGRFDDAHTNLLRSLEDPRSLTTRQLNLILQGILRMSDSALELVKSDTGDGQNIIRALSLSLI